MHTPNPTFRTLNRIALWRVFALSAAGFVFNTTEFIPVALLSDIASDFHMPVAQTGLMLTLYAWIVALCSLPCMLLCAHIERRRLLTILLSIFIASHILSAIAWSYPTLLLARAGIALAHSVFWAITGAIVIRIAPRSRKVQAIGIFAMGVSLATVLGLPLGRVIGHTFGWRTTFAVIGIAAFIIAIILRLLLPILPSRNAGSWRSIPQLLRRPALMCLYLLTAIAITGHFTAYTYIEPFSLHIIGFSTNATTLLLLLYGITGITGCLLYNRYAPQHPQAYLLLAIGGICAALALLLPLTSMPALWLILLGCWSIAMTGIILSLQIRVLQLAPDATDIATAIYSGIFNLGIGGGALCGNQVVQHLGLAQIGNAGFIFASIALGISVIFLRLSQR